MVKYRNIFALIATLVANSIAAQPAIDSAASALAAEKAVVVARTRIDPSNSSPISAARENIKVQASEDNKTASITAGQDNPDWTWKVTLAAPFDSSAEKRRDLLTLDGLSDQSSVTLNFNNNPTTALSRPPKFIGSSPAAFFERFEALCQKAVNSNTCTTGQLSSRDRREIEHNFAWPTLIQYGVTGSVGEKTLRYVTSDTLASKQVNGTSYSGAVSIGVLPLAISDAVYFVGAHFAVGRSYNPKPAVQLCTPFGATGALTCANRSIGAPVVQTTRVAQVEFRKYISTQVAVNPKYTYDFAGHERSVELPIYFIQSDGGGLDGGVNVAWSSKGHGVIASVFVGHLVKLLSK